MLSTIPARKNPPRARDKTDAGTDLIQCRLAAHANRLALDAHPIFRADVVSQTNKEGSTDVADSQAKSAGLDLTADNSDVNN